MKQIQLTQAKVALVDDEYFDVLNIFKWCAHRHYNTFYAVRVTNRPNRKMILMHRVILNPLGGLQIDHINGNGLDNQRANLRVCNGSQNMCNRGKHEDNTSGFKGVCFRKYRKKFQAQIRMYGKQFYLGMFPTAIEAAKVYDVAAIRIHGEFARTNFNYPEGW
jgi:hypothetical protein